MSFFTSASRMDRGALASRTKATMVALFNRP